MFALHSPVRVVVGRSAAASGQQKGRGLSWQSSLRPADSAGFSGRAAEQFRVKSNSAVRKHSGPSRREGGDAYAPRVHRVYAKSRSKERESLGKGYKEVRSPRVKRYTYSERWLFVILTTFSDGTLRTLLRPLASLAVFSLCLWALPAAGLLPPLPPTSSEPHQLLSLSLGLLLVHRMQSAYERFWEARTAFQNVLEGLRGIARRALLWSDKSTIFGVRIASHAIALAVCVREHLSFRRDISDLVVTKVLTPPEYRKIASAGNLPQACEVELTTLIARAEEAEALTSQRAYLLEELMDGVGAAIGECEMLAITPLPIDFATHTSRFLTLFCFTLPLHLVPAMGFPAVPVSVLIAFSLLGIEAIGSKIEAPFSTGFVPLLDLVATFRADVLEMSRRAHEEDAAGGEEKAGGGAGAGGLPLSLTGQQRQPPPRAEPPPSCALPRWAPQ